MTASDIWHSILHEKLYNLQVIEAWFKPKKTKTDEEERRRKENYNTVSFGMNQFQEITMFTMPTNK